MSGIGKSAADTWEVDRRMCGTVSKQFCVIVLRDRKDGRSVVKASSSDLVSMGEYAEQLARDLHSLTNDDFVRKYQLGSEA